MPLISYSSLLLPLFFSFFFFVLSLTFWVWSIKDGALGAVLGCELIKGSIRVVFLRSRMGFGIGFFTIRCSD